MFTAPLRDLETKGLGQGGWDIQMELPGKKKKLGLKVLKGPKLGGRKFQEHTGFHNRGPEHT